MTNASVAAGPGRVNTLSAPVSRGACLVVAAVMAVACTGDAPLGPEGNQEPVRVVFTVQPTGSAAGAPLSPALQVSIQDVAGRVVSSASANVTLELTSGSGSPGAVLDGTISLPAVNGIATFPNLTIDKSGTGYKLAARATGLAGDTSAAFDIVAAAPSRLAFTVQPTAVSADLLMNPAIEVTLLDALGNVITGSTAPVTLGITPGSGSPGASLSGSLSRTLLGGVATFPDLAIRTAGTGYTLTASAAGLPSVTSAPFTIEHGAPTTLAFGQGPSHVITHDLFSPAVSVRLQDAWGNGVSDVTMSVTVALAPGTGTAGASLEGIVTRPLIGGTAVYRGLGVSQPGIGFQLVVTGTGMPATTTAPFDVTAWNGESSRIAVQSEPGDYIGQGREFTYTLADAVVTVTAPGARLSLGISGDETWHADFQLPNSMSQIVPGYYPGVTRYPFHDPVVGGLTWYGEGRGCNTLTGWFAVDHATYAGGVLTAAIIRFEQHCEGGARALYGTIRWSASDPLAPPGPEWPIPAGLWAPAPGTTPASGSFVHLVSESGDYIGDGQTYTYTPTNATLNISENAGYVRVIAGGWYGDFQVMASVASLQRGYYGSLERYPFHNPARGGLSWWGNGRGCNVLTGWFAVDSVTYTNGILSAFDLRFEQRCEGFMPPLHGVIHWEG